MKDKPTSHKGVQDICRRLKTQLDELTETIIVDDRLTLEEKRRRQAMMARLKDQLDELSQ